MLYCASFTEIELIQLNKKEKMEEERRRKTVIVGDMQPLANSLPAISSRYGSILTIEEVVYVSSVDISLDQHHTGWRQVDDSSMGTHT